MKNTKYVTDTNTLWSVAKVPATVSDFADAFIQSEDNQSIRTASEQGEVHTGRDRRNTLHSLQSGVYNLRWAVAPLRNNA